jgi:ribosomal protein S6E (S10)
LVVYFGFVFTRESSSFLIAPVDFEVRIFRTLPMETKPTLGVHVHDHHEESIVLVKGGTEKDGFDMHRMGKLQQLRVYVPSIHEEAKHI